MLKSNKGLLFNRCANEYLLFFYFFIFLSDAHCTPGGLNNEKRCRRFALCHLRPTVSYRLFRSVCISIDWSVGATFPSSVSPFGASSDRMFRRCMRLFHVWRCPLPRHMRQPRYSSRVAEEKDIFIHGYDAVNEPNLHLQLQWL